MKIIPGVFLNSKQAVTAHRLMMAICELKDLAGDAAPAEEIPTSIMEILAEKALDLFEEAEGFHFYDYDEIADRIEHVEGEVNKAMKELESLRKKTGKD